MSSPLCPGHTLMPSSYEACDCCAWLSSDSLQALAAQSPCILSPGRGWGWHFRTGHGAQASLTEPGGGLPAVSELSLDTDAKTNKSGGTGMLSGLLSVFSDSKGKPHTPA